MSGPDESLPESFDVVIIGTGVTESIVSAAASRNGHTVLHLDPRDYYGGAWATLNFDAWITGEFTERPKVVSNLSEDLGKVKLKWSDTLRDFEQIWYSNDEVLKDEFKKNCRRFNIDVFPKVILAREEVIELLIKSNVSRYLEFLRVGKLLTSLPPPSESVIESIPLSRSDIFTSKSVSLVEKRTLVKFIEAILKPIELSSSEASQSLEGPITSVQEPEEEVETKTFEELSRDYKLTPKVKHLIKAAVETLEDGFFLESGSVFDQMFVTRCKKFLQSVGRYGNQTPYLWTLYGISEICQAFCRLSAVYGGLFILKRFISSLEETENGVKIVSEKDEFKTKHLVLGPEMEYIKHPDFNRSRKISKTVGRGVLVTKGGNLKPEDVKPSSKGDGIYLYKVGELEVIEMNHLSQAVPKDYRLLQVSLAWIDNSHSSVSLKSTIEKSLAPFVDFDAETVEMEIREDVEPSVGAGTSTSSSNNCTNLPAATSPSNKKPQVVYGSYFVIDFFEEDDELYRIKKGIDDPSEHMCGKIYGCSTGSTEITSHVEKAKEIFERMFPTEEFLPSAPDMAEDMEENGFVEPNADNDALLDAMAENQQPAEVLEGHDLQVEEPEIQNPNEQDGNNSAAQH